MATLRSAGASPADTASVIGRLDSRYTSLIQTTEKGGISLDRQRAADAVPASLEHLAAADVLELELDGGVRLWTTVERFHEDFPQQGVRGADGAVDLPTQLPIGRATRDGGWTLKSVKAIGVKLATKAGGDSARDFAYALEDRVEPKPGLYHCPDRPLRDGESLTLALAPARPLDVTKPILLLLHGTFSSIEGSFGELWRNRASGFTDLLSAYGGQVVALQHRTLTESPVANALAVANALPAGARLHIVSHSRGGLIGELLCRGNPSVPGPAFSAEDVARLGGAEAAEREGELDQLRQLGGALQDKRIVVERFVRVACPAGGTILASKRLDHALSILLNLLGLVPELTGNPVLTALYDMLKAFTLGVVQARTKPESLPGLEAMMPTSNLVRMLSAPDRAVRGGLSIIAGDVQGGGVVARLAQLAADLFYREDHDFVVHTRAMHGGVPRLGTTAYLFDQGPSVNHFSYFRNASTLRGLIAGLSADGGVPDGFVVREARVATRDAGRATRAAIAGASPLVFLLPDVMGSHLKAGDERIWLDPARLAAGGFDKLAIDAPSVAPDGLLESHYEALIGHLEVSHEVVPFAYDWRQSLGAAVERLGAIIAAHLQARKDAERPVRFLTHGMGGLLLLLLIRRKPDLWAAICRHPGARAVMLGTPRRGTYWAVRVLIGQDSLAGKLALFDRTRAAQPASALLSTFPGILELLPSGAKLDLFAAATWRQLQGDLPGNWTQPEAAALDRARAVRDELDNGPLAVDRLVCVVGRADLTPVSLSIGPAGIRFQAGAEGDGRVSWASSDFPGSKTWRIDVGHGDLARHAPAIEALVELLQTGRTERLTEQLPRVPQGSSDAALSPMAADDIDVYPDADDLAATALGGSIPPRRAAPEAQIEVGVTHANLRFARHPIVVGHYRGDTMISAEGLINDLFDNRMRDRQQLGLYPGEMESSEVFWNPRSGSTPEAAVVIGLGAVGALTQSSLVGCVAKGVLRYAVAKADRMAQTAPGSPVEVSLTFLLIGTGAGGITIEASVNAILRGVRRAAEALKEAELAQRVRIARIELIELYEDVAVEATEALRSAMRRRGLAQRFAVAPTLRVRDGGYRRRPASLEREWWARLKVATICGALEYTLLSDRARAPVKLLPTQRALVDSLLHAAVGSTAEDPQLYHTLYYLLLPALIRDYDLQRRKRIFIVDADSARFPWELLRDRFNAEGEHRSDEQDSIEDSYELVRQLAVEGPQDIPLMATDNFALVVGEPRSGKAPLPGARQEAEAVALRLGAGGFRVTSSIAESAQTIIGKLFAENYRVMHLAGHGVHQHPLPEGKKGESVSGLVLGTEESGQLLVFGPTEAMQMGRVPELVFVNCCHLGRTDGDKPGRRDFHEFAANLGVALIKMGVQAIVAAGWAVDDAAAATFANEFYQQMTSGIPFGRAVAEARRGTRERHPDVNTWGAYQCYGDPDYILRGRPRRQRTSRPPPSAPVSASQLVTWIDNLRNQAAVAESRRERQRLRDRLDELVRATAQPWALRGEVAAAFGAAFAELNQFEQAIDYYLRALKAEKSVAPLDAVEQLSNLEIRHAADQVRRKLRTPADLAPVAAKALARIEDVLRLGRTAERLNLMGGLHKRLATVAGSDAERKAALAKMAAAYREAFTVQQTSWQRIEPYPLLNWMLAEMLLGMLDRTPTDPEWSARLVQAEQVSRSRDADEPSFWSAVGIVDAQVAQALLSGTLDRQVSEFAEAYLRVRRRGSSARMFRSVVEHLWFLRDVLRPSSDPSIAASVQALQNLADALRESKDGEIDLDDPDAV